MAQIRTFYRDHANHPHSLCAHPFEGRNVKTVASVIGDLDACASVRLAKETGDPTASYAGGINGLKATSPRVTHKTLRKNMKAFSRYQAFAKTKAHRITAGIKRAVPGAKIGQLLTVAYGGIAARVPVPDGSVVDLFVELEKSVTADNVHAEIRAAAESTRMKSILQFVKVPVVSSDIIGNAHSSIFDAGFTTVTGGRYLKCLSWYDNEWGYSNQLVREALRIAGGVEHERR